MPNMLKRGAEFLARRQKDHTSEPIVYVRGPDRYADTPAVVLMQNNTEAIAEGMDFTVRLCDFIIQASDLPNIDAPREGDTIEHDGQVYELNRMPVDGVWRWADSYHLRWRVHTQHTGAL